LAVEHVPDQLVLRVRIAVGLDDEQHAVIRERRGYGAADSLAREWLRRDGVRYQADGVRNARAKPARDPVRPVVELPGRAHDPVASVVGDPHVCLASGEDERGRGSRHPGAFRDLLQRDPTRPHPGSLTRRRTAVVTSASGQSGITVEL
jgi:hypothetical protein